MEWFELVLTAVGGSITGLVGSIIYFRPKLKEAKADASKKETEASDAKVKYLIERVESVEKLYAEQGKLLDEFRRKQFTMDEQLTERNRRISELERENKVLSDKVARLEQEVQAYKTIAGK